MARDATRRTHDTPATAARVPRPPRAAGPHRPGRVAAFFLAMWAIHLAVQIDKPVHIDDPHYLSAARHLLREPLRPFCNLINWKNTPVLAYRDNINPPFYVYLQAGWMLLFGDSIRGLHVLASLMVLLAGVAGYALAARFTGRPMLATALFLFSPTLLPVTNLMLDVPALAVGLGAAAVFIRAVDSGRTRSALLGGLLTGAAVMTKYNSVVLLPVLALYAVLRGRARLAAAMLIPVGVVGLWMLHNYCFYDNHDIHVLLTIRYKDFEKEWWPNVFAAGMVLGSSFVMLMPLYLWRMDPRGWVRMLPVLAAAGLWLIGPRFMPWWDSPAFSTKPEYFTFVGNTALLMWFAAARYRNGPAPGQSNAPRRPAARFGAGDGGARDTLFLWAWVLAVMAFQVLFAYHQSPRYHLLAFPPFAYLLVRAVQRAAPAWGRLPRTLAWGSLAAQSVLALAVAGADHANAASRRDYVRHVTEQYGLRGKRVHFLGHWGLQYYAEEEGFTCFDAIHVDVRRGDYLIVPQAQPRDNIARIFYLYDVRQNPPKIVALNDQLIELVEGAKDYPNRWGLAVNDCERSLLYATVLPRMPYTWRPAKEFTERLMLFRFVRDYRATLSPYLAPPANVPE